MRASVLFSGVTALWALVACGSTAPAGSSQGGSVASPTSSGGKSQSGSNGGSGGSGGSPASGGITSTDGIAGTGGIEATGGIAATGGVISTSSGARETGGATLTSTTASTGGRIGTGGAPAGGALATGGVRTSGGVPALGGATASGGIVGTGGKAGTGGTTAAATTAPAYQGPCDVLANGCAEAYGVARAMTSKYTGPLFQLGLAKDTTKTLDIGQTSDHKADMTTWSAFCGGTQSNCVISKIYAQIHKGSNDLLPAVWNAPWGPNCSAGGYTCAAKFTIEAATSLPIVTTVAPQEYALSGDNYATGINGGSKAIGLMYNGKPVASTVYCCGVFGLAHKYNAADTYGTDFMVALAYGWRDSGGCCIAVNCGKSNTYCVGAEEEENNDLYDYGTSPIENAMVVTQFDPTPNAVIAYLNGTQVLSHSPPAPLSRGNYPINAGTAIHLGGGGDLSQPDPILMREALVTNAVMSSSEVTAMKTNIVTFFSMLKFP